MSLHRGAKTIVGVRSELSKEFLLQVGVHQGSVLSPLLFAIAVDAITENAVLYADDLVLMSASIEHFRKKFLKD